MLPGGYDKAEPWRQHIKGPVQSSLQFQSSKSRRTEAKNRATGGHFLFTLSQPMQTFYLFLMIDDCLSHTSGLCFPASLQTLI